MDFWSPIRISLEVTLIASFLSFFFALIIARWMSLYSFKGKPIMETVLLLPLVLPPSVVGFGLLVLFGKTSWIGQFIEWIFHQSIVFTSSAAIMAATVVAFPLAYQTIKTGFESIDKELEDAARSMGASEFQIFYYVSLPLIWRFTLSGYILGFARALGEFGATLMFAGDIPGKTETIPTAIFIAVESGNMNYAYYWVISIVVLSFILLSLVPKVKNVN